MRGSRASVYLWLLIGGLVVSQVVPTFGAQLGFTGNWLPFFSGLAVIGAGVALYIVGNKVPDRIIHLVFFVYGILAVGHTIVLMLVYSELTIIAEYADIIRWLSLPVFVLAGYIYGREAEGPVRGLFKVAVLLVLFTIVLFVDFLAGPWSGLQRIYLHHEIPFGRFPGNWNYPYNFSVAVFFYVLAFSLAAIRARKQTTVVTCVAIIGLCILWIVIGQSRGSLLALGIVSVVGVLHGSARIVLSGRVGFSLKPLSVAVVMTVAAVLGYTLIDVPLGELLGTYAARLVRLTGGGIASALESGARVDELRRMIGYFADSPLNLFWGFGPFRRGDFWIQNILLLVFRYGVLGFALYVLILPAVTVRRTMAGNTGVTARRVGLAYLYWLVFVFANSMSHDIFSHYRFMPLFYFVSGVLLALPRREDALVPKSADDQADQPIEARPQRYTAR